MTKKDLSTIFDLLQTVGIPPNSQPVSSNGVKGCLFAEDNTEKLSGPCMVATTCGGMEESLRVQAQEPNDGPIYDYCTANNSRFDGEASLCNACLQHMPDNKYLSNCKTCGSDTEIRMLTSVGIAALQAGCIQRPSQKALTGFDGSLFSHNAINATAALSPAAVTAERQRASSTKPLSTGPIASIAVAIIVTFLVLISVIGIKCYKRRQALGVKRLRTRCHPRFGATDITAPAEGSYSEYKPEPVVEVLPWDAEHFILKDIQSESSMSGHSKSSSNSTARVREVPTPEHLTVTPPISAMQKTADGPEFPAISPRRINFVVKSDVNSKPSTPKAAQPQAATSSQHFQANNAASVRPTPPSQLLTAHNLTRYATNTQLELVPRPNYASSIASSASTTFSPGVYSSPPPPYLLDYRPSSVVQANFPIAPLPSYNPASYAPKPNNLYRRQSNTQPQQPQFNTQSYQQTQRFQSSPQQGQKHQQKSRPHPLTLHKSASSQASARYTPFRSQPQPQPQSPPNTQSSHRPSASQSSVATNKYIVPKRSSNPVPIIALPIPAPKRQTVDMRSLVGLSLSTHVKPDDNPLPSKFPVSAMSGNRQAREEESGEREPPLGFDKNSSLIRRSGSPFRELAEAVDGKKRMTAKPADLLRTSDNAQGEARRDRFSWEARSGSVVRAVSRASFRGRSNSRPRRDGMEPSASASRERGREHKRQTSESRNNKQSRTESKTDFKFEFRGQDTLLESSPQSGSTSTRTGQWPGTGIH